MRQGLQLWCVIRAIVGIVSYSPQLSWDVCSPSRIVVTLTGAVEGGIIYIRGYGASCRQTTSANQTQHEFDFQSCGIVTGETYFTIIVQKSPLYQTGSDLQESLLCIYDLSDITVGNNVNVGDKNDDAGINKTVKPTGFMMLYKDGLDIGGQNVKLSDLVTMAIQLDNEFVEDFDIKAMSCTANFIDIIKNFCAEDTALFPNFQHAAQGMITSTFGAFRTTDLGGGYVEMIFSCTVQVCRGLCSPTSCSSGDEGWGRRRRRRDANGVKYDELNIGASFSVGTETDQTKNGNNPTDSFCVDNTLLILVLLAIFGVLVTSLSLTVHVTSKLMKRNDELRNLTGVNNRQRRSLVHVVREQRKLSGSWIHRNLAPKSHSTTDQTEPTNHDNASVNNTQYSSAADFENVLKGNTQATVSMTTKTPASVLKQSVHTQPITQPLQIMIANEAKGIPSVLKDNANNGVTPVLKDNANNGFTPVLNGTTNFAPVLKRTQPGSTGSLTNHNMNTTYVGAPRPNAYISGTLIEEKPGGSKLESLLGLNLSKLGTMTDEEKKNRLMECQNLLNRLKLTQFTPTSNK